MPTTSVLVPGGVILTDDQGNPPTLIQITPNSSESGWADVQFIVSDKVVATPTRYKMTNSAGRVAADFPGCDPQYVIVDTDGRITNG